MRLLVCGGRNYGRTMDEVAHMVGVLNRLHAITPITALINGGASGADDWAREWARGQKVKCVTVPANWNAYGKAAGPIRNQRM